VGRHSWLPLAAAAAALAVSFMLISRGPDERGQGGPQLEAGIFPEQGRTVTAPPAEVLAATSEILPAASSATGHLADRRSPLVRLPWNAIALVADDRDPLTKAAIFALGEFLSGQVPHPLVGESTEEDSVCIVPLDGRALPLQVHRLLRIRTRDRVGGERPGGRLEARLEVEVLDARQQSATGATGRLAAGGVREIAFTVRHRSGPVEATVAGDWASWYAGVGRHLAGAILAEAIPGEGPTPLPADGLGYAGRYAGWKGIVPLQYTHEVVRWEGAFQEPLIRGWAGRIMGTEVVYRQRTISTLVHFRNFLESHGWKNLDWKPEGRSHWTRGKSDDIDHLLAVRTRSGWALAAWLDNPDGERLRRRWITTLRDGGVDPAAAAWLRRYVAAGVFSDAEVEILAASDDPRDRVALAAAGGGSADDALLASWVGYCEGLGERPDADPQAALRPGDTWDRRPSLAVAGDACFLLVSDGRLAEATWREDGVTRRVQWFLGEGVELPGLTVNPDGMLGSR